MKISRVLRAFGRSRIGRLAVMVAAAFAFSVGSFQAAQAQDDYPNRPVKIILAFGTGGVSDIVSRLLAEHLEQDLGVRFIVENHPGAFGAVAAQVALSGDNEGYTLYNLGNATAIRVTLMPSLPFGPGDFEMVTPIAKFGLVMVTAPDSEFKTVQDVLDFAKSNPGGLNIGTVSVGSTQNLSAELLKAVAGIDATVIPFKNSPDVMGAVARGEVHIAMEIIAGAKNAIAAGQVRAIATTQAERSKNLPDVPTVEESGLKPFDVASWNAYASPKGIPAERAKKLNAAIQAAMKKPEIVEKMLSFGIEPFYGSPEAVSARMNADIERWAKVITDAGVPIKK